MLAELLMVLRAGGEIRKLP